jgi:putative FmdB family regulatory protein
MPLYEYRCKECGHTFERLVFDKNQAIQCPECFGAVEKLMSAFNVDIPDEACAKLPKGQERELCTECRQGGGACPFSA